MVLFLNLPIGFMNTRIIPSFKLAKSEHAEKWS